MRTHPAIPEHHKELIEVIREARGNKSVDKILTIGHSLLEMGAVGENDWNETYAKTAGFLYGQKQKYVQIAESLIIRDNMGIMPDEFGHLAVIVAMREEKAQRAIDLGIIRKHCPIEDLRAFEKEFLKASTSLIRHILTATKTIPTKHSLRSKN